MVSSYYCSQPIHANSNSSNRAALLGPTPQQSTFPFSNPIKLKTTLYMNLKVIRVQELPYLLSFKILPLKNRPFTHFFQTSVFYCSALGCICIKHTLPYSSFLFQKYNTGIQVRQYIFCKTSSPGAGEVVQGAVFGWHD